MDAQHFESLLYRGESETLDFKVDQYSFENATDDEKGKLLKDILAFANAWRESEAYILIGVEEKVGSKAVVRGITKSLDDHALQQFVNAKTQRPVTFGYEVIKHDGIQCGIIRIPNQERPLYLVKDFGGLAANQVYIRRGSSTTTASPDEIAGMRSKKSLIPTFQVRTGFTLVPRPAMAAEMYLEAVLKNAGQATAHDVQAKISSNGAHLSFPTGLWELVQDPHVRLVLMARKALHPGDERQIATWNLGYVALSQEQQARIASNAPAITESTPVGYSGGPLNIEIRILARDQSAARFHINISPQDVALAKFKAFEPIS